MSVTDLIGKKFNHLLVIEEAPSYVSPKGVRQSRVKCLCDCGKEYVTYASMVRKGKKISCGCEWKKNAIKSTKKYNEYEVQEDYVIMYTSKGEMFLVDLEDFWKVREKCWCIDGRGYVVSNGIRLSRFVMNCKDDKLFVDHRNHDTTNNMKYNLRIATEYQNQMNVNIHNDNTSGVSGVHWNKKKKRWMARISVNGKRIYLGCYSDKSEAVKARKEAEEKYYGEWSYDNSINA